MVFTALHELGHLVLDHGILGGHHQGEESTNLPYAENISLGKSREFEADAFAFAALEPGAAESVLVTVLYLFTFFFDVEIHEGVIYNTTPLTINRISRLIELVESSPEILKSASIAKIFNSRLDLMRLRLAEARSGSEDLPAHKLKKATITSILNVIGYEETNRLAVDTLLEIYRNIQ